MSENELTRLLASVSGSPEAKSRAKTIFDWIGERIDTEQACAQLGLSEPGLWALHDQVLAAMQEAIEQSLKEEASQDD